MAKKYPTTSMCDGELLERFEACVRDTDVFIPTTAKCGQTWLQTLLFHLKTKGHEPNLRGLGLGGVSPWLELPFDFGYSQQASTREERLAELEALDDPRIFKMHVVWDEVPRPPGSKARMITITRDPRDVPYSMFSHLQSMNFDKGEAPPSDFDEYFERWMKLGYYFQLVASYWPHRDEPDFLWLRYEDMKRDLEGQARRLVEFLGWDVNDDDIARVLPLVDFSTMQARERKDIFRNTGARWKEDGRFFREGGTGKNRARLSVEQERRILARLRDELPPECCDFVLALGE
jgi:hypothetical protein